MREFESEAAFFKSEFEKMYARAKNFKSELKELKTSTPVISDLMRDSLGLPMIHFENVDSNGFPPHFLAGLVPEARKQYISEMVQIYKNEKFKVVMDYTINLLGNHSIQKADKDKMENGRIGIIALKTFRKQFEDVLAENDESRKVPEDFDEHAVLSEA